MRLWKKKLKKMPSTKTMAKHLIRDIGYGQDDIYITADGKCVIIKNIVVLSLEEKQTAYYVSFASGTTALGACMIVNCLHNNGASSLVFKENFYIGRDKLHPEIPKTYHGDEADNEWNSAIRKRIEEQIRLKENFLAPPTHPKTGPTMH